MAWLVLNVKLNKLPNPRWRIEVIGEAVGLRVQ